MAFVMWRIERRPVVLGTLLLALAAVLLFIPAQSYPGSLLPANFAMVTTRNIEYVVFVGALILAVRARRAAGPFGLITVLLLALLFASDKLFVSLAAGTAVISGLVFLIARRYDLARLSGRLLILSLFAYAVAWLVLLLLRQSGVHFDDGSALGPYGLVQGPKELGIAIAYAGMSVLTNLGANPAFATLVVKDIPAGFLRGLLTPIGPGYAVTLIVVVAAVRAVVRSVKAALVQPMKNSRRHKEWQTLLAPLLTATSLSALGIYIISNHYYPADARYLAIILFTAFIALATAYRSVSLKTSQLVAYGGACLISIAFGILFQAQNLQAQNRALGDVSRRNATVATALKSHPTSTLLGNYWRVMPIKLGSPTINVTPLEACGVPRQVLSSKAWQPDLRKTSFAYILRLDGGLAGFPACTLADITARYGRPDSSVVIEGTRTDPREILLFYDDGIHFLKSPAANNAPIDTVTPISVDTMPFTTCPAKTVMQFVAHEDDDILFMNPDLAHDIKGGNCIRSVFFTAGDAGHDKLYWLGRQHGAEEAYNTMLGTPGAPWTERIVSVDAAHTITVANPRGNHAISLIFLHLPDGSPEGTGFASKNHESLRRLLNGAVPAVHPVDDDHEKYTADGLTDALRHLMDVYQPDEVRSQSTFPGKAIKDHSDHNAVGEFATRAFARYQQGRPDAVMSYYMGYPVHELPANVSGADYSEKVATFLAFSRFDGATCHSLDECNNSAVYGLYLSRQYTYPY